MHIQTYMHICVYSYTLLCVYIHIYSIMCIYTYIHIYVYTHAYIYDLCVHIIMYDIIPCEEFTRLAETRLAQHSSTYIKLY